jgi:hypothetical protein
MRKIVVIAIVALTASAYGHTEGTRAVTGGLIGAGIGALTTPTNAEYVMRFAARRGARNRGARPSATASGWFDFGAEDKLGV